MTGLLGMVCGLLCVAGEAGHWRIYDAGSGLSESFTLSVNVSPRGNVWVRHPVRGGVSGLDGYQIRRIDAVEDARYPIHESRTGQIWSLYQDGLMEYRRDRWIRFPVESIRSEHQTSPGRLLRSIPLLPVERDHVLVLLPQHLSKHNPAAGQSATLRRADQTALGSFIELIEARDGGAWLTGSRGLAKLPGPIRRLSQDSIWEEHEVPAELGGDLLSRPFEDDEGVVTVVGERLGTSERLVMDFDGEAWGRMIPAPDGTRMAWRTGRDMVWAQARGNLHRWVDGQWEDVQIPGMPRLQILDVATEPHGVFWLATSEGLVRHAPASWRRPRVVAMDPVEAIAIEEDQRGALWLPAPQGLHVLRQGRCDRIEWPSGFALNVETTRPIASVAGGRMVIAGQDELWLFDVETERFAKAAHPKGRQVLGLLGSAPDDGVTVVTGLENGEDGNATRWLETFDGDQYGWAVEILGELEADEHARVAVIESHDRIWLGTNRGLWQWNPASGRFEHRTGVPSGAVTTSLVGPRGRLWFGGEGRVLEYDGRTWALMQTTMGTVRALHRARDGVLWAATSVGAACYVDGTWIGYETPEGLPTGGALDVQQDRFGQIWVATVQGLYRHYPESDLDEPRSHFLSELTPREVSTLRPVTLVYAGRDKWDYTPPDRLLFSHRLNEGPWSVYRPETSVTFSNLPAGKHRLAVRAMDRNQNEESEPAVWEFLAFVPWYAEPRLVALAVGSLLVAGFLAWLAVNRHMRLVRSHAEVERIVADRTRELEQANRELLHSHKMRALGTLAAGIAHDFNNILSIIKGSVQIIEVNLQDKGKIRTRLNRIATMVEQGSGIVRTMLGFSRASDWNNRVCDLNRVTDEAMRLMNEQLGPAVRVECRTTPGLPAVRGVPELIRQMLLNLVFNAADAMGGRGTIEISTERLDQLPGGLILVPPASDGYVAMAVSDHGHGITPEVMPRIFEPFFSTKAFSTRRGTGLGLTMVYEIAKELGLGLGVESMDGQGARFRVILPFGRT